MNLDNHPSNEKTDLETLGQHRLKYINNPLISYLNINSLRNKIVDLREIMRKLSPDYLVLSETKLDDSFPNAQFYIDNYEIRARRDRDKHGGGLIEFVRRGFICKRLPNFETKHSESICSELLIAKKKWLIMSIYRPPTSENLNLFFDEMTTVLSKASENYENLIVMGDFNIDTNVKTKKEYEMLDEFCNLFSFSNLISLETCFTRDHSSSIDHF